MYKQALNCQFAFQMFPCITLIFLYDTLCCSETDHLKVHRWLKTTFVKQYISLNHLQYLTLTYFDSTNLIQRSNSNQGSDCLAIFCFLNFKFLRTKVQNLKWNEFLTKWWLQILKLCPCKLEIKETIMKYSQNLDLNLTHLMTLAKPTSPKSFRVCKWQLVQKELQDSVYDQIWLTLTKSHEQTTCRFNRLHVTSNCTRCN